MGCSLLGSKDKLPRNEELLWSCLKEEELSRWKDVKLVYAILSLNLIDPQSELPVKDSINLVRNL